MITIIEMNFVEMIRSKWHGESWSGMITSSRFKKAAELLEERRR